MSSITVAGQERRRMSPQTLRNIIDGYICILPWIIGFLGFTAGPIVFSLWVSFNHYDVLSPPKFAGIDNYINMVNDDLFWQALKVTTIYVLGLCRRES